MISLSIAYFFEDFAHQTFMTGLVSRLVAEKAGVGIELKPITICEGGGSKIYSLFKRYTKDWKMGRAEKYDIIVVVNDANCKGVSEVRKRFENDAKSVNFPSEDIVYAIPDPYIERWYLADCLNFTKAVQGNEVPSQLPYMHKKTQRHFYKDKLIEALQINGIESGGTELGEDIAKLVDFSTIGNIDSNFASFIDDFRRCLSRKLMGR